MATQRRKVSTRLREQLRAEAGGKCANPGCANRRTELHHVREWAIYRTHDRQHMIAVCPACHDAIHHGEIPLSDDTLVSWKRIVRAAEVRDHIWVEPGAATKLLLGTIAVSTTEAVTVFRLSEHNELSFRIADSDILLTDLRVTSLAGVEIVRVTGNHLRHMPRSDVTYRRVPGRVDIFVPATEEFIPHWALAQKRQQDRFFALGNRVKYVGLRVLEPGLLRVEGIWAHRDRVVIITDVALSFCSPGRREPLSMVGDGKDSVLHWAGPITTAMFGFQ